MFNRFLRTYLLMCLVSMLVAGGVGCGKRGLDGAWTIQRGSASAGPQGKATGTVTLDADGTAVWEDRTGTYSGTWRLQDDGRVLLKLSVRGTSLALMYTRAADDVLETRTDPDFTLWKGGGKWDGISGTGDTGAISEPTPDQQATAGGSQSSGGTGAGSNTMPGVSGAAKPFDPDAATAVADSESPEAYVKRYYQAILDKKWEEAFKMQPAASQQGGTVADFEQTQASYGMTAFKIVSANEQGDTATVEVEQNLGPNGTWGVTWTFVKNNGSWVVQSRKVQMK